LQDHQGFYDRRRYYLCGFCLPADRSDVSGQSEGQHVKKEPSDKLICLQGHRLLTVVVGIIPPAEGNITVSDGEDSVITDGDSMGMSAEVL